MSIDNDTGTEIIYDDMTINYELYREYPTLTLFVLTIT